MSTNQPTDGRKSAQCPHCGVTRRGKAWLQDHLNNDHQAELDDEARFAKTDRITELDIKIKLFNAGAMWLGAGGPPSRSIERLVRRYLDLERGDIDGWGIIHGWQDERRELILSLGGQDETEAETDD